MSTTFRSHLANLNTALTALGAAGHAGFEGLLAAVFSAITTRSFRLAGSGSQHGKDGGTAGREDSIAFEAKLYTGAINKNEVLSKLTEIIASEPPPDLWVLGATIEIKTQIVDPLTRVADKNGINLLLLDWSPTAAIPELAVTCALANEETIAFLDAELDDPALVAGAQAALLAIRNHAAFSDISGKIIGYLCSPGLAPPMAVDANRKWLGDALSDERLARRVFGQALAPQGKIALPVVERNTLLAKVTRSAFGRPRDEVVVLAGGEGSGKSWIFAQAWLSETHPPLTLVIPAALVPSELTITSERDFLIRQIIRQTGDSDDQPTIERWRKVLKSWDSPDRPARPNLLVFIDGLNQRPAVAWGSWLDGLAHYLDRIGGRLVISVREGYFEDRVARELLSPRTIIRVEEWSQAELAAILAQRNIDIANLGPRVVATLRNPRVLGIAFELLEEGSVANFDELSVERLLFEHIRKGARYQQEAEDPAVFTRRLSSHAGTILSRIEADQSKDRLIFESTDHSGESRHLLSRDLLSVSNEKFFRSLPDDPLLYELSDDGLVLALGFAILDALSSARRNSENIAERLDAILEPIAALDKTAQAVFAGLLISSVDERSDGATTTALMTAYLRMQNLDEQEYPAFESIVRGSIDAAMEALAELVTSPIHAANDEWLTHALHVVREEEACWQSMERHIARWLTCYSLDPKVGVFRNDAEGKETFESKLAERADLLESRMGELSSAEATFLAENMARDDRLANGALARQAFNLLVGKPLANFSGNLVAWALSQALNSGFQRPYDELLHLVRFNKVDWAETRQALLRHAEPFSQPGASSAGKWAFVHVLRATSTLEDAERCSALVAELTRDRERYEGWRLIEKYCATDPCDPGSTEPENIKATARKYRELEPENLRSSLGMTQDDHFLRDASFGLARFDPETAIAVQRNLIDQVSKTATDGPVHRMLNLRDAIPLVSGDAVERLLDLARNTNRSIDGKDKVSRDSWIIAQNALLLSFPHIGGDAQLEALMSLREHGPPLLDLADVLKPASADRLEDALDRCLQSEDPDFKLTVLMFARYSETELTERARATLRKLVEDPKSSVRALAIGTLVESGDEPFLSSFAKSDWNANMLNPREGHFERWDGARAIAAAYEKGQLGEAAAVERISHQHYHMLASAMAGKRSEQIPRRLDASLRKMLAVDPPEFAPIVEQEAGDRRKAFDVPLKSISEPEKTLGPDEFFKRMSESEEDFDERQKRGWDAYDDFEAALTKLDARQILDDTSRATLELCASSEPELLKAWAETICSAPDSKVRNFYNFGLRLADALSKIDPGLSARLFAHLRNSKGFVNIVHGPASLGLESMSVWHADSSTELDSLKAARLDRAKSDDEISQEVLAALAAGRESFLDAYIQNGIRSAKPANVARALMVCGFAPANERRAAIIDGYLSASGMIGAAAKVASYAYERNVWAMHWYDKLRQSSTAEEFWQHSVLFLKLVDGRYQFWDFEPSAAGSIMHDFEPGLWNGIKRRIKAWRDKRAKTYLGEKAPLPQFIA